MLKNAALACVLTGVALCAYADKTPPPKVKPPVAQANPNQALLHSFSVGSTSANGTAGNAGGTGVSKGTGTNGLGTGNGSGKVVEKSSTPNLKQAGTSQLPPASSLGTGASSKPQVKAPTRLLHPN